MYCLQEAAKIWSGRTLHSREAGHPGLLRLRHCLPRLCPLRHRQLHQAGRRQVKYLGNSVPDPNPDPDPSDPHLFGPPGSGSTSQRYESGSGSISQRHGSADPDPHQNVMDPEHSLTGSTRSTSFGPPGSGSTSQRYGSGSGSISQRHGSADPDPDPHQNVLDPEHCLALWPCPASFDDVLVLYVFWIRIRLLPFLTRKM
jgi:hypothetical protein